MKKIGPDLGKRIETIDPIIDRSPEQKRIRVEKLRVELSELGYSVVTTKWLHSMMEVVDFYTGDPSRPCSTSIALRAEPNLADNAV